MRTSSKANSVQLTDLVTPPRAEPFGSLINFRESTGVVNVDGEDQGHFASFPDGNFSDLG